MLSIIISTKNEEEWLPLLLNSIRKQDFHNYEIIVSDANSTDKTRQIAKKFRCRIVKGGVLAVGNNNGARYAKGDVLLFLDADAVLPDEFLVANFKRFVEKKLEVANCYKKPISDNLVDKIMHAIANMYYYSFKKIRPYISSDCLFVKRDIFFKVGRFDENVPWLIDLAFSNALPKDISYDILPVPIKISVRMAKRLGRLRQARILLLAAFMRALKRNYYVKYKWKNKK